MLMVQPLPRIIVPLVVVVALISWGITSFVGTTTRHWFERDFATRARLAVSGAHHALASYMDAGDWRHVEAVLQDLARNEHIIAAQACSVTGATLARTRLLPKSFSCSSLDARATSTERADFSGVVDGGDVHVSVLPVMDGQALLGTIVLVHDMADAVRREATLQELFLAAFLAIVALCGVEAIVLRRIAWRSWVHELRRLILLGRGANAERFWRGPFQPLLADLRRIAATFAPERARAVTEGTWSAERLQEAMKQTLDDDGIVVIANREPYIHERAADGAIRVVNPASGLVTALEPVMRACSGTWIAHGSGSADAITVDANDRVRVPPGDESYALRRIWLSEEEERGYYYGFSNEGLWPLCHIADARPVFGAADFQQYRQVNARFADAVPAEVAGPDPIVLVQDYHFALAPQLIRQRLPHATVLSFWHIPWPNAERFGMCPFAKELLTGLLGSSIVGFHTQLHCNNFIESVERYLEARIDREAQAVIHGGRETLVRSYPISVEWPNRAAEGAPPAADCRWSVFAQLGLAPDALLGVGVDRLDYTKGIEERLLAVERLLEHHPELRGRFTFAQLAAPSRTLIERYRRLDESVEALAARINERFGAGAYRPIALLRAHHQAPDVFRFLRAADVCYVSSLDDGMNLVAKEFVAARDDHRGVLVLSRFTGAARELKQALIVNPYDLEEASGALAAALALTPEEQGDRMRALRAVVSEFNVYRWAGTILSDAARVRHHGRVSARLSRKDRRSPAGAAR